ncbi:MAG: ribonuclease D [Steroidobacteraceae bacterium]
MSSSTSLITDSESLQRLAEQMSAASCVALDTEFMRERTYRAELCLLQVATPAGPVCVDPLALADLAPLRAPLAAPGCEKVLHAARQDLEVLAPLAGALTPVFDTQVAAALAGFPAQVGYGELVRRLLDHELPKAHTRADWSRRPLSPEQIEYALDDVRYLLPVRELLLAQLHRLGRERWLAEELAGIADPAALAVQPERAWLRLKGLQGLDPARAALAQSLAAWRERRAIARNRPRGWILDDGVLREMVLRVPRSAAQLAAVPAIPEGVVRNSGEELLALVSAANVADPPPPLPRRERPDPQFNALVKRLAELAQHVAREHGIAAEVLATRRDLETVARGESGAAVLAGWRREVLGERLLAAL